MVIEAHSGRVLATHEPSVPKPVASLTKIATAVIVLDWAKASQTDLGAYAMVPASTATIGGANPMGLQPGDRITLRNALYSALLGSDNAAAHTLANHVGLAILKTRNQPGDTVKTFVQEMNQLAKAIGMKKTKFANPHGLDHGEQRGYSTASDMVRLAVYAMRNSGFAFFVKQKSRKVSFVRGDRELSFTVQNTNQLLGTQDINGVKTGMTAAAGQCLATSSERTPLVEKLPDGRSKLTKRRLICVVLGSADRFARTRGLVQQGWESYDQWLKAGAPVVDAARELLVVPNPR